MELSELQEQNDQQIKRRDDTIAARQQENQLLREVIQTLKLEHNQQIKERDESISARQQEIQLLKQRHAKQLHHYKNMLSKYKLLTPLSQYPIGRCMHVYVIANSF